MISSTSLSEKIQRALPSTVNLRWSLLWSWRHEEMSKAFSSQAKEEVSKLKKLLMLTLENWEEDLF